MTSTVGEIARQFNVSENTVRNWAKWHADHLSDNAKTTPRRFTDLDLATFNLIAEYRSSGFKTATINERLCETQVQVGEIVLPDAPQSPSDEQEPQEDRQVSALLLQAHTEALQRLTARLERQRIAEVSQLAGEVRTLRTWQLVQAAVVVVLIVAVVSVWVVG